jgi:hypothetical protein
VSASEQQLLPIGVELTDTGREVSQGAVVPPGADMRMELEGQQTDAGTNACHQTDYDYDRQREQEVRQLVAVGKLAKARERANSIRGRKLMLALLDWIDQFEQIEPITASRHGVGGHG